MNHQRNTGGVNNLLLQYVPTAGTVSYNQAGQYTAAMTGTSALASYNYDGFGQRLIKTVSASYGEIYQYGQNGLLLEETNASGVALADYIYLDGRPVAVLNGSTLYYLHDDMLVTPQLATDSNQAVQWQASYDPFGQASVSGTVTQNLRLPGQYFDVESGWNHNGFRDYAPTLGRYIEPDPLGRLGSGNNLYVYVFDNPTNLVDPLGLCATGKRVSEGSLPGMFLCGVGGIPGQLANLTGITWGIGLGGSAGMGEGLIGIGGEGGLLIVADPQGNVGIIGNLGGALAPVTGVVAGAGALGGGQVSFSFTKSIYNLTGASIDAGGSVADELGIGFDVSKSLNNGNPGGPWTGTITAGVGLGGKGGFTSFAGSTLLISTNCKGVWGW